MAGPCSYVESKHWISDNSRVKVTREWIMWKRMKKDWLASTELHWSRRGKLFYWKLRGYNNRLCTLRKSWEEFWMIIAENWGLFKKIDMVTLTGIQHNELIYSNTLWYLRNLCHMWKPEHGFSGSGYFTQYNIFQFNYLPTWFIIYFPYSKGCYHIYCNIFLICHHLKDSRLFYTPRYSEKNILSALHHDLS